jgi:hypothetical protein
VVISCQKSGGYGHKIVVNMNEVEPYEWSSLFNQTELIKLYLKDSSFITSVDDLKISKERFFILDLQENSIFTFNINGQSILKLQHLGKGPGEYMSICDFAVDPFNNNFELLDGRVLRTYDSNGKFIKLKIVATDEIRGINHLEIIDKDYIAFLSLFSKEGAVIYNRNSGKIQKKQSIHPVWARENIPFNSSNHLYPHENGINYFEGFSNKVYHIDKDGWKLNFEWDFGKNNFDYNSPSAKRAFSKRPESIEMNTDEFNKCVVSFFYSIENTKYIMTSFMFQEKPTALIYSKMKGTYKIIGGEIGSLLATSKVVFYGDDQILIIAEPIRLKILPIQWFSLKDQDVLNELDLYGNPVLLKMKIKQDF